MAWTSDPRIPTVNDRLIDGTVRTMTERRMRAKLDLGSCVRRWSGQAGVPADSGPSAGP